MAGERDASFTLTSFDEGRSLRVPNLRVTVTLPDGRVLSEPLGLAPLVLGQSAACDLVVADPKVSRKHCAIRLTDQGLLVQDLGSRNGTLVRDIRVVEAFVEPSVPVTIGDSKVVVQPAGGVAVLPLSEATSFGPAVGQSLAMRALFAKLERAAPTDETVLLLGESGTGKEVLARAIHENSRRKGGPFMVVDCGALASSILESELFGAVAGAATGVGARAGMIEMANRGTLFIDEIGELPLELQQKLLRVLEDRKIRRLGSDRWQPIDVRVIAATHRNLKAKAAEGTFRQDLYYRLAVLEMAVPSLRERKEDIPMFVEWFLAKRSPPSKISDLPPETIPMLMGYDWPGNVRELRNVVARLVLFPELLHEIMGGAAGGQSGGGASGGAAAVAKEPAAGEGAGSVDDERLGRLLELTYPEAREAVLSELERKYAAAKLRQFDGNISRTAEAMGVSRPLLHRLLDRHGMRSK
jgi:transcriptional regulator with PAS, ATPase and Fis domain